MHDVDDVDPLAEPLLHFNRSDDYEEWGVTSEGKQVEKAQDGRDKKHKVDAESRKTWKEQTYLGLYPIDYLAIVHTVLSACAYVFVPF